jgi:DNA-directed RNA polymerase subunit RPC12/RpoP
MKILRCPECGSRNIRFRIGEWKETKYICQRCGAVFEKPKIEEKINAEG